MSDYPELYYWIYLLPVALLAFWLIRWQEGKLKPKDLPTHLVAAGAVYFSFWSMGLFRLLVHPLLFAVFAFFLWAVVRSKNTSKVVAATMLGLFLVTGLFARLQRDRYGAYWELSREQERGSFSWIENAAKEQRFTKKQLLGYLKSDDRTVIKNARKIAALTAKEESDLSEARAFCDSLKEIDLELAEDYFNNLPHELRVQFRTEESQRR